MNSQAGVYIEGYCLHLRGNIDFNTATALLPEGERWLNTVAPRQCCIDLGAVQHSNSAGMALLLAWLRTARRAGKMLEIRHVPDVLDAIIRLAGLEEAILLKQ